MTDERMRQLRALCEKATGYEVSRDGRVFSTASNWRGYGERELTQTCNASGYASVRLTIDGRRRHYPVHRLIADAFLSPRPSPEHQIRHLDGDRMNPRADNLAWGTAKENANDRDAHGTTARGVRNGAAKLTADDVAAVRAMSHDGRSQRFIAKVLGVSQPTIGNVLRGETWK